MKIDFTFELDQLVEVTVTKKVGVITMCAVDDGGKKYYVQADADAQWWPERLLVAASN